MKTSISNDLRQGIQASVGALSLRRPLEFFKHNDGGQLSFARSQKTQRILSGGNDSGKTVCDVVEGAYHILPAVDIHDDPTGFTIHPYKRVRIRPSGVHGWFSNYSEGVQRDNFRPIYDKYLAPYELKSRIVGGARKWADFESNGRIEFKCVTQGFRAYRGTKVDFIGCDEPHPMSVYNECLARIIKSSGSYMWTTMTPVIDETQTAATILDILWMKRNIIDPWLRDPDDFPLLGIIFVSTEENAAYVDVERTKEIFRSMSPEEQSIRLHGMFLSYIGQCYFNKSALESLQTYIIQDKKNMEPEYVELAYDGSAKDEFKIVPRLAPFDYFGANPAEGYAIRVWEHPLRRTDMIRPEYFIAADVAEGKKGGDFTNAYVLKGNGQIVASLHGLITEIELARQLYLLGMYYCDRQFRPARLAIEVNNYGKTTQALLITGSTEAMVPKYGRDRMLHRADPSAMEAGRVTSGASPGWLTTSRTRPFVLSAARQALSEAADAMARGHASPIPDVYCIDEGLTFILGNDGKFKAQEGFYDDRIMSLGIGRKLIEHYRRKAFSVTPQTYGPTDDDNYYKDPEDGEYYMNTDGMINRVLAKRKVASGTKF